MDSRRDKLLMLSVVYAALPLVIFILGWLKVAVLPVFLPLILALLWPTLRGDSVRPEASPPTPFRYATVSLALAVLWTFAAGIGEWSLQNADWPKHNGVLFSLIHRPWPITYSADEIEILKTPSMLVYYLGYYLVAGAVGAKLGWAAAVATLFFWSVLGLWIGFQWLGRLSGRFRLWIPAAFIFFGGLDVLGFRFFQGRWPNPAEHIDWWSQVHVAYPSPTSAYFWAPQHLIAVVAIFAPLYWCIRHGRIPAALLLAAVLPMWSPFIAIGAIPFAVYEMIKLRPSAKLLLWSAAVLTPFFLLYLAYFMNPTNLLGLHFSKHWESIGSIIRIMTFHLFEWAIFLCFAFAVKWQDLSLHRNREEIKTIFLIALVLFFLPMLTSRLWNDWALRGSMPALFLLSVVWLENVDVIMTNPRNYLVKLLAIVLVLLGAGNACLEIQRAWPAMQALRYMNYPQKDLSEWFGKDKDYGPQYFSPIQGPFEKYFMKK